MPAHMGRDFGKLNLVSPIILFQCIMKIFFPVKRHFRLPVFVQKQKPVFPPTNGSIFGFGLPAMILEKQS